MSEEKQEHWAGWADGDDVDAASDPECIAGVDTGPGSHRDLPVIAFPTVEARDAALRDLAAMAALRAHGPDWADLPADYMGRTKRHCRLEWVGPNIANEEGAWACGMYGSPVATEGFEADPADAILAALETP